MSWFSKKLNPLCINCEFLTSYQMLNNRDQHVDVNHCSLLSFKVKSVKGNYIEAISASISSPESFSCNSHKPKLK